MLLKSSEPDIQLVQRGEESAKRRSLSHLREGVDILREALAAVAELAVRARDESMRIVYIT